jgi:phenylalanine-4-hydroxylase
MVRPAAPGTESLFSLESDLPGRTGFTLGGVMYTQYRIDDFQKTGFAIDELDQLQDLSRINSAPAA